MPGPGTRPSCAVWGRTPWRRPAFVAGAPFALPLGQALHLADPFVSVRELREQRWLVTGLAVSALIPSRLGDLLPAVIREGTTAAPPLLETFLAVAMIALLTLPPLVRLGDVKPLVLLREGAELQGGRIWLSRTCAGVALALAVLLIIRNAPSLVVGLGTALGMALLFLLLYGEARLLLRVYRSSANAMPLALRLACGQLGARPGLTALMMAVMGLAVFLTTATQFIKDDIVAPIASQQGQGNRPNLFFLDVQAAHGGAHCPRPAQRHWREAGAGGAGQDPR